MGEESTRLKPELSAPRGPMASGTLERKSAPEDKDRNVDEEEPAVAVNRLRTEIDSTRDELGTYIAELDRRRHEAFDLKLQLKKHPGVVIAIGVGIVAAAAGAVAMVVHTRKRETLGRNAQRAPSPMAHPARAEPSRMLKFLLESAIPIGIGVARGFLGRAKSRRHDRGLPEDAQ